MNKKNNKGFLLAESLIVATFVLTVLIYVFGQFKNLMSEYKKSYIYNSVQDIYNLGSIDKYLRNNNLAYDMDKFIYEKDAESTNNINELAREMNIDYIIYTDSNKEEIKLPTDVKDDKDLNSFIQKMKTLDIDNKARLIAKFDNNRFATIVIDKLENSNTPEEPNP